MRTYAKFASCKEMQDCPTCNGTGKAKKLKLNPSKKGALVLMYEADCPVCEGTGFVK